MQGRPLNWFTRNWKGTSRAFVQYPPRLSVRLFCTSLQRDMLIATTKIHVHVHKHAKSKHSRTTVRITMNRFVLSESIRFATQS